MIHSDHDQGSSDACESLSETVMSAEQLHNLGTLSGPFCDLSEGVPPSNPAEDDDLLPRSANYGPSEEGKEIYTDSDGDVFYPTISRRTSQRSLEREEAQETELSSSDTGSPLPSQDARSMDQNHAGPLFPTLEPGLPTSLNPSQNVTIVSQTSPASVTSRSSASAYTDRDSTSPEASLADAAEDQPSSGSSQCRMATKWNSDARYHPMNSEVEPLDWDVDKRRGTVGETINAPSWRDSSILSTFRRALSFSKSACQTVLRNITSFVESNFHRSRLSSLCPKWLSKGADQSPGSPAQTSARVASSSANSLFTTLRRYRSTSKKTNRNGAGSSAPKPSGCSNCMYLAIQ